MILGNFESSCTQEMEESLQPRDSSGYYLIVADTGNNMVQVVSAVTGQFIRLIGGIVPKGYFHIHTNRADFKLNNNGFMQLQNSKRL